MEKCFNDILKNSNDLYNTGNIDEAKALLDKEIRELCNDENSKDLFWNNQSADLMKGITIYLLEENPFSEALNIDTIKIVVENLIMRDEGSIPEAADNHFDFNHLSPLINDYLQLPARTRMSVTLFLREKLG